MKFDCSPTYFPTPFTLVFFCTYIVGILPFCGVNWVFFWYACTIWDQISLRFFSFNLKNRTGVVIVQFYVNPEKGFLFFFNDKNHYFDFESWLSPGNLIR